MTADSRVLLDAIQSRLRLFGAPTEGADDLSLVFRARDGAETQVRRPAGASRPLYELPGFEFVYFPSTDQLFIERPDQVALVCDPASGTATCSYTHGYDAWLLSHLFVSVPLVEMLKRRGLFSIHAAGVAVEGRSTLFAGLSGSGKSTLSLCLLRDGFGFLGDDTLFLRREPQGLRVLAFPDEIDVTETTARFFPELEPELASAVVDRGTKRPVRPEHVYDLRVIWDSVPDVLVFPVVTDAGVSSIEPLEREAALVELIPNIPLTDHASSQAHLDALAELVSVTRCYRLRTGRDLHAIPALIHRL